MAFDGYFRAHSSSRDDGRSSYDPAYERDRQRIDLKLKGTFERIFEKYAKDFSSVGDEIDMETGEVVVNNGHLTYMQHERDTGKSASSRFVRAFAEELEEERENEDDDDDNGEGQGEDSQEEEEEDDEDYQEREQLEDDVDDYEDGNYDDDASDEQSADESDNLGHGPDELALDPLLARSSRPAHNTSSLSADDQLASSEQHYHNSSILPSTELTHSLPPVSINDSLNQLIPHQDASGRIDPDAINALGQSIASQIAQFLMRATSFNRQPQSSSQAVWSAPPLPRDAFSPPALFSNQHRPITPAPHRLPSVVDSPSGPQSLWAPAHPRKKRRRLLQHTETSFNLDPALVDDNDLSDISSVNRTSNRRIYSRQEDDLIKRLREINGLTWEQITTYMPGRTTGSVSARYTRSLKNLPRPVLIKREIIEIMDEDDLSTPGPSASPGRPPPNTPLLRQALDSRIARRGETGDAPITIADDDDGTDSQRESSAAPVAQVYSDGRGGYYKVHPITGLNIYPSASPDTDASQDNEAAKKPKKNKRKTASVFKPRYRTFDTLNSAGHFGVLRPESPAPFTATMHDIGPRHATTSGFGVLKLSKQKQPKTSKKKAQTFEDDGASTVSNKDQASDETMNQAFSMNAPPKQGYSTVTTSTARSNPGLGVSIPQDSNGDVHLVDPTLVTSQLDGTFRETTPMPPPPPYSVNPLQATTPVMRNTHPLADTENDGDVSDSDSLDTPATATRYADTIASTSYDNGPYFLSNLPPLPSPQGPSPQVRMRRPSSPPPLPTPMSHMSTINQMRTRDAAQANKDELAPPGPAEVARMTAPRMTPALKKGPVLTPKTPLYGTPVRETVGRQEMTRKRIMAELDDGSEDELA